VKKRTILIDKNKWIAWVLAGGAILLVALTFFLIYTSRQAQENITDNTVVNTPTPKFTPTPTPIPGDTIMITDTRFVPKTLTIKKDSEINFINFSGKSVEIVALDEESSMLNLGVLEDNDATSMILFKNEGTYKYFNRLNPEIRGEIIVQ